MPDGLTLSSHALVMELVDGEDLAAPDRRARPRAAGRHLAIARQIADALDAAHEQGIIHRDLSTANVKVRADGTVRCWTSGWRRPLEPVDAVRTGGDLANSPTITSPAMRRSASFSARRPTWLPKQAGGRHRRQAGGHRGLDASSTRCSPAAAQFGARTSPTCLAAVVKIEPEWSRLPADTASPAIALRRCLRKGSPRPLRDIGDARVSWWVTDD